MKHRFLNLTYFTKKVQIINGFLRHLVYNKAKDISIHKKIRGRYLYYSPSYLHLFAAVFQQKRAILLAPTVSATEIIAFFTAETLEFSPAETTALPLVEF